ncbi:MAG: N-acetylmuramoyl-L-alanine amidase [Clostridia bacterium]|nr:N-acetylmuramoyl-L-alanine amidase [Clostridia bacterium]
MISLKKVVPYFIMIVIAVGLVFVGVNTDNGVTVQSGNNNMPVVIIDAGHGGVDGGAVSSDGTQEQYINLDIARKINEYLTKLGYKTIMTRSDDNSIHDPEADTIRQKKVSDIHNRLKIIETNPGSIFVSVHLNYYSVSKYKGAQVFYSPNNTESEKLAHNIQSSIVSLLQPDNTRQIKKSDSSIYLLYHSPVPSVMVECGFLSNAEETEKLKNEDYRMQMATAICKGIINYLNGTESETAVK